MGKDRDKLPEGILNLTLEIIYLLTGEDYIIVKKSCKLDSIPFMSEGLSRAQSPNTVISPHSLIYERDKDQKILQLTNKIIHLVTGEVPLRCEDVTVYFSTEEWEYVEEHKDMYPDFKIKNYQPLDGSKTGTSLDEFCPSDENVLQFNQTVTHHKKTESGHREKGTLSVSFEGHIQSTTSSTADHVQSTSTYIKEEPESCDGETDTNMDIPTQSTSTHIKEEPVSCNGGTDTNMDIYTHTDHTDSTHIKEEQLSCDGGTVTDTDIYTITVHTLSTSTHIKEEQMLCDGENLTDHTESSTTLKEEPVSCDGKYLTKTDICTPTDHTLSTSTPIKEEPVSCDGGTVTDIYMPTDHTQSTSTHIKVEPVSCDGATDIDAYTPTFQPQSTSTHIMEDPVSRGGGTQTDIETPSKDTCQTIISTDDLVRENTKNDPNLSLSGCKKTVRNLKKPFYKIHERSNMMVILYNCPDCDKSFTNNLDLVRHQTIHKEKWFQCSRGAGKLSNTKVLTTTDTTQHKPNCNTVQSPSCDGGTLKDAHNSSPIQEQAAGSEAMLSTSARKKSGRSSNKPIYTIKERPDMMVILYNCPDCHEAFTSNLALAKHQVIHSAGKRIQCSECGLRFCR